MRIKRASHRAESKILSVKHQTLAREMYLKLHSEGNEGC